MPFLVGYITPQDYGAKGDGVTDDTAAINSALAAANTQGGGTVFLPWGTYLVSNTISIPPYVFLVGQSEISLNLFTTPPSNLSRIVAAASWAPSSSTGIVSILSKTPGGWSVNTAACGLRNIFIDGSLNSNSNLNGINMVGPAYDVHLDDVFVWKAPHNGLTASGQSESGITPTFPYHQRYTRVTIANSSNTGFNLVNFTDSTFDNCLAFGNGSNAWSLQNNSNSILTNCRGEWSTVSGRGFNITGSSGSIVLTGCTTDNNAAEGLRITAATGQATQGGGVVVTGGKFHADGNNGTDTNGIRIIGSTVPVTIVGTNVESGQNPNNSNYYPVTGLLVGTSSNVTVSASILQGISSAWTDGGGNTNVTRRDCIGMTGNPGSQVTSILSDIPPVGTALPSDQNLIAWTYDPALQTANSTITAGVVYLSAIYVRTWTTVTNVLVSVITAGSGLTSGQNFAGLYNGTGTLLSATADQTTNWGSTGLKTTALSAAQTVAPGTYYLAMLSNGTTTPAFSRATVQSSSTVNAGTTASTPRYATSGTAQTALPGSITMSATTPLGTSWWGAFS